MLAIPKSIKVVDVGPRDGLQSFPDWVDTEIKVKMIDRLSELGLPVIEVSSFAHPRVVPHLRDAEDVFARIKRRPGTTYRALVPNSRGAYRAAKVNVDEMLGLITISATYTQKNQGMSMDKAIEQNLESLNIAESNNIPFVMALGMAFWCAYEGVIPEQDVIDVVHRLYDGGVRHFYLAGSVGMEDPVHVNRLFSRLNEMWPRAKFGFHVHNLSGMATANILAALDGGADWLESSICGIGGGIAFPDNLGSVGNFPTEDLVSMLSEMGIETGVGPEEAIQAAKDIAQMLNIKPKSHRGNGATRKAVAELAKQNANIQL